MSSLNIWTRTIYKRGAVGGEWRRMGAFLYCGSAKSPPRVPRYEHWPCLAAGRPANHLATPHPPFLRHTPLIYVTPHLSMPRHNPLTHAYVTTHLSMPRPTPFINATPLLFTPHPIHQRHTPRISATPYLYAQHPTSYVTHHLYTPHPT
jgi:hypothetical protein